MINNYTSHKYQALLSITLYLQTVYSTCSAGQAYEHSYGVNGLPVIWVSFFIVSGIAFILFVLSQQQQQEYNIPAGSFFARAFRYGILLSIISILIGLVQMPSGYYFYYLRIVLSVTAATGIASLYFEKRTPGYIWWTLIGFAILYNPIIPIILGSGTKHYWSALNIVYAGFLIGMYRKFEGDYYRNIREKRELEKQQLINELHNNIAEKSNRLNLAKKQLSKKSKEAFFLHLRYIGILSLLALAYSYFFQKDYLSALIGSNDSPIHFYVLFFLVATIILSFLTSRFQLVFTTEKKRHESITRDIQYLTSEARLLESKLNKNNTRRVLGFTAVLAVTILLVASIWYRNDIDDYLGALSGTDESRAHAQTQEPKNQSYNDTSPSEDNSRTERDRLSMSESRHTSNKNQKPGMSHVQQFVDRIRTNLSIQSSIDKASIRINGESIGTTTLNTHLGPGTYHLEIFKPGYRTWTKTFEITEKRNNNNVVVFYAQLEKLQRTIKTQRPESIQQHGEIDLRNCLNLSSPQDVIKCAEQGR